MTNPEQQELDKQTSRESIKKLFYNLKKVGLFLKHSTYEDWEKYKELKDKKPLTLRERLGKSSGWSKVGDIIDKNKPL